MSVQPEFDPVSDVDQRVQRSADRSHEHLPFAAKQVLFDDGDDARRFVGIGGRRSGRGRDEAVEKGEVIGVVAAEGV